jgi:hypothetical protein
MTELCKLAVKYGSDRTPHTGGHAYTPYYYELFKGLNPKRILEIGIDTGRGLRMWREYFPEAEIFGLDGNSSLLFTEDRIRTHYCDLGSEASILEARHVIRYGFEGSGNLDIVFDDGSHVPQHQISAAKIFLPIMNSGGIYIIEDVGHPEIVVPGLLPYKCEVVTFRPDFGIGDDRLVILRAS